VSQKTNIIMAPNMITGAIMAGASRKRGLSGACARGSSAGGTCARSGLNVPLAQPNMQASTCMSTPPRVARRRPPARQLLLSAAARVFARDGLEGATTRAISREAGVNEVTLFRQFGTKEHLLEAVVGSAFGAREAAKRKATGARSLRGDLEAFACEYENLLVANLPLIRTMIGEIHRHAVCQQQALKGIFWPMRAALVKRIRLACRRGEARGDLDPAVAADMLAGTIFSAVLRRTTPGRRSEYSASEYRDACVSVFLGGISA